MAGKKGVRKTPPCKFGKVLAQLLKEKDLSTYDIEEKGGIAATTVGRFAQCLRFPSPFRTPRNVFIGDLARLIGLTRAEKKKLYKALIETFYGEEIVKNFPSVDDKKITDEYIKTLLNKKPANKTWMDIYEIIPEPTVRKIRNLRDDISLFNARDVLKDYLKILKINDKNRAEILYYFLKKKGVDEEFLELLRED